MRAFLTIAALLLTACGGVDGVLITHDDGREWVCGASAVTYSESDRRTSVTVQCGGLFAEIDNADYSIVRVGGERFEARGVDFELADGKTSGTIDAPPYLIEWDAHATHE